MENEAFPSNSHSRRDEPKEEKNPKRVERVTTGEVIKQKKTVGRRFRDLFVDGGTHGVGSYILFEIVIPAAKDTIADVVSQGIERMLYGDARSSSRRTGGRPSSSSYTPYNRYSTGPAWRNDRREEPRQISRRSRASHNFDDLVLATRTEAEEVIDQLFQLISNYDQATVADLYELVGLSSSFTDAKWGWVDLRGAGVTRTRNGYLLDLPRPEPLD